MRLSPRFGIVAIVLCLFTGSLFAQNYDYTIRLAARQFTPYPAKSSIAATASAAVNEHIYIQFDRPLTESDRAAVYAAGIDLLEYIPNLAYRARLTNPIDQNDVDALGIRWADRIPATDKLSPMITEWGFGEWTIHDGNKVELTVVLQLDEDINSWVGRFEADFGAQILGVALSTHVVEMIIPELEVNNLAQLDAVAYIEPAMPPQEEHNDIARINTGADVLQSAPYNYKGQGVRVAQWDGGLADNTHPDLRFVVHGETEPLSWHATHCAGTVMGSGSDSNGLYRGMAPSAKIVSYLWWSSSSGLEAEMNVAINGWDATVSTNSWGTGNGDSATQAGCEALMGAYPVQCRTLDDIVRGSQGAPITICWSAGNQRGGSQGYCGALGWTYLTVSPYGTAKNIITVGAINSVSDAMTSFSSWGPTQDGRVKPDVVGPGCVLTSCNLGSGYIGSCGTSMSCPSVAGIVAIMREAFAVNFPDSTLLPSTIKALLVASAEDLGEFGPDFAFGHGKVDGVAAVDKLLTGTDSYLTADISTGETHSYDITVPSGTSFKVALVWDDPGAAGGSNPTLVNDLDLVLIDPLGVPQEPHILNPASPSAAATQGVDRLNNVETFTQDPPMAGLWQVEVSGFNIPVGPQTYSLAFTPDYIHTPGNTMALAVYNEPQLLKDPGDTVTLEFWVSNVGAALDSLAINISDNTGWLLGSVDTTATLSPFDSVYFSLTAVIPELAVATDLDSIVCFTHSLTDSSIISYGRTILNVSSYYAMQLQAPFAEDTTWSPQTLQFAVQLSNNGNASDQITLDVSNTQGWPINPASKIFSVPPMSDTSFLFSMSIPAEVAHLTSNLITVDGSSTGGSSDLITFSTIVDNPLLPPTMVSPSPQTYMNDRTPQFDWSGVGDSYILRIASDTNLTTVLRTYTITDTAHSLPISDSLIDGKYYWGVRQFLGTDSSSYQKSARRFVIDNSPPVAVKIDWPINNVIVAQKHFTFFYSLDLKSAQAFTAPEYHRLEIARDSDFTVDLHVYDPIDGYDYQLEDTLDEGRWYWQVQRQDSAGNQAPMSTWASFILDSETPAIPTLTLPADNDTISEGPPVLKWTTGPPPLYEASAEYFHLQMSTHPEFYTIAYAGNVYTDSLPLTSGEVVNGNTYYWRVRTLDSASHSSDYQTTPFSFIYQSFVCGNVDGSASSQPDIADITYLVAFMFKSGPDPIPLVAGSVNCDEVVDISDLTYLVSFMFKSGAAPCCN